MTSRLVLLPLTRRSGRPFAGGLAQERRLLDDSVDHVGRRILALEALGVRLLLHFDAACQADQCPDTSAHSENAETYTTLSTQKVTSELEIMITQNTASQPLTRRMNTGSPCTMAHKVHHRGCHDRFP